MFHYKFKSLKLVPFSEIRFLSEKLEDKNQLINESPRKKKNLDRLKGIKTQKKNVFCLELKSIKNSKTSREPVAEDKPEIKRNQKPSDKVGKNDSVVLCWDKKQKPEMRKFSNFSSTWDHTNYFVIPSKNSYINKDCSIREKKYKKMEKIKKQKNKSGPRAEENMELSVNRGDGIISRRKKKPEKLMDYSTRGRPMSKNNSDGQAIIIYQRNKRKNYIDPTFTRGYRVEQISFAGSCETTLDLTQSKRSLSEPRQKSLKEFYVAHRRTRLQLKPDDVLSEHSNFCSTMDFIPNKEVSDELRSIQKSKSNCLAKEKALQSPRQKQEILRKSKSNTEVAVLSEKEKVERRLKETAVKKLDLHREMLRLEKIDRKKFWESIKQSLNYRCALANMFSSQSFLSQNTSAKFFSSTENSTEIFVREGVIEKISSYQVRYPYEIFRLRIISMPIILTVFFQGFHRFAKPKVDGVNSVQKTTDPTSGSTYREMKTMLGSILIKEEDEDLYSKKHMSLKGDSCTSSSCRSVFLGAELERNALPESASEKLTMMENSLKNSSSELQFLMSKLFNEIKQCSDFIKMFEKMEKKKESLGKCAIQEKEWQQEKQEKTELKKSEFSILPVMIYPAINNLNETKVPQSPPQTKGDKISIDEEDDDDYFPVNRIIGKDEVELKRSGKSDSSLKSFPSATVTDKMNQNLAQTLSKVMQKNEEWGICCDDCKYLKQRIVKLEKELERIEKKMPLYPSEYQDSIKVCLERLKATSETVLKRLKSCAKMRYEDCSSKVSQKKSSKNRSLSAPEPITKKELQRRLAIRPSISDYNLNVGMEITMENVDPITGEKLHPEVSNDMEQEGNIQCKVFKEGETPFLVVDTDFSYNPRTGGKHKKKSSRLA